MNNLRLPDFDMAIAALPLANRHVSKPSGNRASEFGSPDECLRKLVYARTHWDQRQQPDDYLMGIFETGKEVEEIVVRNLVNIGRNDGFRLIETQKTLEYPEYQIVGHCDGLIQIDGKIVAGMEIKSVGNRFKSLVDARSLMTWNISAKWYGQAQLYMLLSNYDLWALLLVNKQNLYETRTIWLELDYDYAEKLLQRAKTVNRHIAENTVPEKMNEPRHCLHCPFAHVCMPDLDSQANRQDITDPNAIDAHARMKDLETAHTEYTKLERVFKAAVKETLPECHAENFGELIPLSVGDDLLFFKGYQRKTAAKEESVTYYWRQANAETDKN